MSAATKTRHPKPVRGTIYRIECVVIDSIGLGLTVSQQVHGTSRRRARKAARALVGKPIETVDSLFRWDEDAHAPGAPIVATALAWEHPESEQDYYLEQVAQ